MGSITNTGQLTQLCKVKLVCWLQLDVAGGDGYMTRRNCRFWSGRGRLWMVLSHCRTLWSWLWWKWLHHGSSPSSFSSFRVGRTCPLWTWGRRWLSGPSPHWLLSEFAAKPARQRRVNVSENRIDFWCNDAHLCGKRVVCETGIHVYVLFVYPTEWYVCLKESLLNKYISEPLRKITEKIIPYYWL